MIAEVRLQVENVALRVHFKSPWRARQAWHGHDISGYGVDKTRTYGRTHIGNFKSITRWTTLERCLVGNGEISLSHANGKLSPAVGLVATERP